MIKVYDISSDSKSTAYEAEDQSKRFIDQESDPAKIIFHFENTKNIKFTPSFGDYDVQPNNNSDYHRFLGSCRLFSEKAIDALDLKKYGDLIRTDLTNRDEKFYWFWCKNVIDCLDNKKTVWMGGMVKDPVFIPSKIPSDEIFINPTDQGFQVNLWASGELWKERIKRASLRGFILKRTRFDKDPWRP